MERCRTFFELFRTCPDVSECFCHCPRFQNLSELFSSLSNIWERCRIRRFCFFFVFLVWPFPNTEPSTELRTGRERPRRIQRETSTEHRVTICASGGSSPPGTIDSVSAARSYLHPGTWRRAQTQPATNQMGTLCGRSSRVATSDIICLCTNHQKLCKTI